MTLCQNKEYQIKLHLGKQKGKKIVADFKGGQITSDAGAVLLSGINKKYRLVERITKCLDDYRDNRYTEYDMADLISQRLFQIACGYEDCNDANSLRNDPLFKIINQRDIEETLASQPTLSRLENTVSSKDLYRLSEEMLNLYMDTKNRKTKRIILDIDITADEVFGQQQLSFFHGYYGEYVYLPLLVFDGETGKLISAILQPGNTWGGFRIVSILRRIVDRIKERFPDVEIVVRTDSGFATPNLYDYCESAGIRYIIGLGTNGRLEAKNDKNMQWAYWLYRVTGEKQKIVGSFEYQANSWSKPRRIIAKTEWNEKGSNQRFLVTDLTRPAQEIYDEEYCQRGEDCENRIKELKLDIKADRLSCNNFKANQFRLIMHGFAYWLLHLLREEHLKGTELERSQMGTIRLKLIKIGAQIISRCRRIWIHLSSGYPLKKLFALIVKRLRFSSA